MKICFGQGSYDDPMEALTKLKYVGSVEEYKTLFETLTHRVFRPSETHKLSCFLRGLKDDICLLVRMFNPRTLVDAYSLAKIQEEYLVSSRKSFKPPWNSYSYQHPSGGSHSGSMGGTAKGITPNGGRATLLDNLGPLTTQLLRDLYQNPLIFLEIEPRFQSKKSPRLRCLKEENVGCAIAVTPSSTKGMCV